MAEKSGDAESETGRAVKGTPAEKVRLGCGCSDKGASRHGDDGLSRGDWDFGSRAAFFSSLFFLF